MLFQPPSFRGRRRMEWKQRKRSPWLTGLHSGHNEGAGGILAVRSFILKGVGQWNRSQNKKEAPEPWARRPGSLRRLFC